jgi:hypothetical protein
VVFDSESRVIAATFKVVDSEVDAWLRLLDKRDDTIASGIILLNEQYDVHRYVRYHGREFVIAAHVWSVCRGAASTPRSRMDAGAIRRRTIAKAFACAA